MGSTSAAAGRLLVAGTAAASLLLLLHGLLFDLPHRRMLSPWQGERVALDHLLAFAAGAVALLAAAAARRPVPAGALLSALLAAALFGVGAVTAVALCLLVALLLGTLLLGTPGPGQAAPGRMAEDAALALAAGLAALAGTVQLLVLARINFPAVHVALAAAALWAGRRRLAPWLAAALAERKAAAGERLAPALFAGVLAVTAAYAARPELLSDALVTHLAIPLHVADFGRWHFDPARDLYALMPKAAVWLVTPAAVLAGEPAAKLMNLAAFAALCGLLAAHLAPRTGARVAWAAAAAFAAAPMTVLVASGLMEEAATALFALGAAVLLMRDWQRPGRRTAVGVGLMLGACVAAKYHGLYFGTLGLLLVARLALVWPPRAALGHAAAAAAAFAAVGPVPYALAWWRTGNPVFPYLNDVFRSPLAEAASAMDPRWSGNLAWDLPYRLVFDTGRYLESGPGAFGFQYLVLVPVLLAALPFARRPVPWVPALAAACFTAVLLAQIQYARYLFYILPLVLLVLPAAVEAGGRWARPALAGFLALATGLNLAALGSLPYPPFSLDRALRPLPTVADVPYQRPLVEAVNALHGPAARVWFTGEPLAAGLQGEALNDDRAVAARIAAAATPEEVGRALRASRVTHVVAPALENADTPMERFLAGAAQPIAGAAGGRLFVLPPVYVPGERLSLRDGAASRRFLLRGWSAPESWGVWSMGPESVLRLPLAEPVQGPLRLELSALGLLSPQRPAQTVAVLAGGVPVGEWTFTEEGRIEHKEMLIPAELAAGREVIELALRPAEVRLPREIGLGGDPRPLGLAVHDLRLSPAGDAASK
ncbi:MAG TPA: hypothetical protein VEB20_11355 [Azospirillaceae bacterium]|nr:hypothetical protein [Azospirillaceae bacterium]